MTNIFFESTSLKVKLFAWRKWFGFLPEYYGMLSVTFSSILMKTEVTGIAVTTKGLEITLKIHSLLELKVLLFAY